MLNEYELILIIREVFRRLGMTTIIRLNNRKILTGMADVAGVGERITDITVEIDKLEKIGADAVTDALRNKGIADRAISLLMPLLNVSGTLHDKLDYLEGVFSGYDAGNPGRQ
jgi:histidyl-tRNA synthetase